MPRVFLGCLSIGGAVLALTAARGEVATATVAYEQGVLMRARTR